MSIRYSLQENLLTADPDDFRAVVVDMPVATEKEIVAEMVKEGSTVTTAEALAVIEEYTRALLRLAALGFRVRTDLVDIYPTISGVFLKDEAFNKSKHTLNSNVAPGNRLAGLYDKSTLERVEGTVAIPQPEELYDSGSESRNAQLSPGGAAILRGTLLKTDPGKADEGIFLIPDAGGEAVKVTQILKNKPAEVFFLVPALPGGSYSLEVRSRPKKVQELRTGWLSSTLSVAVTD